ncbi:MAG: hypothetical protein ACIALR_12375 [Blastopirellula sp. JB062]
MIRTACLLGIAILSLPSLAKGAVVLVRGEPEPASGYVERRPGGVLLLRIPQGGGKSVTREIPLADVEEVIETVSPNRLAELDPAQPDDYRNYAEELAQKKVDPEARETALRLFLIAARLDPQRLGRSSLLGMTSLARSSEEARRFRAMAFLLDPDHDVRLIQDRPATQLASTDKVEEWSDLIITGLRKLRGGDYRSARSILRRNDIEKAFDDLVSEISYEECQAILTRTCDGCEGSKIPLPLIRKLVLAELALLPKVRNVDAEEPGWAELTAAENHQPLPTLTLETITEFDPRNSVYRQKQWKAP